MRDLRHIRLPIGVLFVLIASGAVACGNTGSRIAVRQSVAFAQSSGNVSHFRFFSSSSFWNKPLEQAAPLDPHSSELIGVLNTEVDKEIESRKGPWINVSSYSVPVYRVSVHQSPVRVELVSPFATKALQSAFRAVPLPPSAEPSAGTDGHLVIWQPGTDRLWEFWQLRSGSGRWEASWGGAIRHTSSNPGVYGPSAWAGAARNWGASASSLSIAGGLITLGDLHKGYINHALSLSIPNPRAEVYASPARRTDGTSSSPLSLPEGAHLRINPALDLSSLHLPPLTLMMAHAAQRFGLIVRDKAANVTFNAQPPRSPITDPYSGDEGFFEGGSPAQLLASFPWSNLEVLKMNLHHISPSSSAGAP